MHRKLILTSVVLVALLSCSLVVLVEADSSVGWSRTYGGPETDEEAESLVATSDGGYAIAGVDFLVKTDAYGNMEWNQTYSIATHSLVQTSDGGYAMAGGTRLIKTNAFGEIELNKTYEELRIYALVQTSDGGYSMAGDKVKDNDASITCFLAKTDSSGIIEWKRTYGKTDFWEKVRSLVATSDGGYLLAGQIYKEGEDDKEADAWLVKTNSTGHIEWTQSCGRQYVDEANAVVEASDGGYVIAGSSGGAQISDRSSRTSYSVPSDLWLFKIDEDGNREWEQTHGGDSSDYAYSIVETSDGGYAIAGKTNYDDCWLVKTDAVGNMQWNKTYDGRIFSSLVQASDGGYVIAGEKRSPVSDEDDFWLMKTDEFGVSPDLIPDSLTQEPWNTTDITIAIAAVAIVVVAIFVVYKRKRKLAK